MSQQHRAASFVLLAALLAVAALPATAETRPKAGHSTALAGDAFGYRTGAARYIYAT